MVSHELLPWAPALADARGLRYEPEGDDRWLRAWEPFVTLSTPERYAHVMHATGPLGSMTIARMGISRGEPSRMLFAWIAVVQDERLSGPSVAVTNDRGVFAELSEGLEGRRVLVGDSAFDAAFSSYAREPQAPGPFLSPSLCRLLLSWKTPLHLEVRPGGFLLAPLGLEANPDGCDWLLEALPRVGAKALKRSS